MSLFNFSSLSFSYLTYFNLTSFNVILFPGSIRTMRDSIYGAICLQKTEKKSGVEMCGGKEFLKKIIWLIVPFSENCKNIYQY